MIRLALVVFLLACAALTFIGAIIDLRKAWQGWHLSKRDAIKVPGLVEAD